METGVIIALCALIVSVIGMILNGRKETRQDATEIAEMKTLLSTINSGVTDIRVKLESMREKIETLGQKVSALEARVDIIERSVKQ